MKLRQWYRMLNYRYTDDDYIDDMKYRRYVFLVRADEEYHYLRAVQCDNKDWWWEPPPSGGNEPYRKLSVYSDGSSWSDISEPIRFEDLPPEVYKVILEKASPLDIAMFRMSDLTND